MQATKNYKARTSSETAAFYAAKILKAKNYLQNSDQYSSTIEELLDAADAVLGTVGRILQTRELPNP